MKKTDVKKTERSKEFLAEEWLEIVLKGQDKGKSNHEKSVQGDAEQLVRTGRTGQ